MKNAPLGTSLCGEPFIEATVREVTPSPIVTYELENVLSALTTVFTNPAMPFSIKDDDFGSAISSLIGKNLVKECEGMIFLSDTADDIMDNIGRLYPGIGLMSFRADADSLASGIGTGRQCMAEFGDWLYTFTADMLDGNIINDEYTGTVCPVCGAGAIHHAGRSIRCGECGYHLADTYLGRRLTPELTRQLLTYFYTSEVNGLQTEEGRRFSSVLALDANYQPTHIRVPDTV